MKLSTKGDKWDKAPVEITQGPRAATDKEIGVIVSCFSIFVVVVVIAVVATG